MKKKYLLYTSALLFIFVLVLVVWPNRTVNLDIGSFHYHKIWEGPSLSKITSGRINNDLNLNLGADFRGGTFLEYKVNFPDAMEDKAKTADQILELIRSRLTAGGYNQSEVTWELRGEDYYLSAQVEDRDEADAYLRESVFKKGVLQLWGESAQPEIPTEITDQAANTFESFLDQNYDKLEVNANDIKGYRVIEDAGNYTIRIALSNAQAEALYSNIFSFFGKNLLAVLDEQFIVIDGADLGEQVQTTGKIKTLNLTGFQSKADAKLMAGIIQNGPLSVELEQTKTEPFPAKSDENVLGKIVLTFIGIFLAFGLVLIAIYKIDGAVGFAAIGLWGLIISAGLKILPINLTVPVIFILGLLTGIFFWMLLRVIKSIDEKNRIREEIDLIMYFRDAGVHKEIAIVIYMMLICGAVCLVTSIWPGINLANTVLLGTFTSWFIIEQFVPITFKFTAFLKEKDEHEN
ncbi:MAG: hypothetical protein ABIE03_00670 [Patescibacteria group bacterium]|nr:hypothetical protein [Patescibacteria group bacterium]